MPNRRLRSLALVLPFCLALAGGAAPCAAAAPSSSGLQTPDYRIETDETHWNFNTGAFTMPHRVRFYRPGTDAVSDKASGNSKNGTATLVGSVVVHDSGNASEASDAAYHGSGPATLTCDQLDIDSKARLYTATGHVHFAQGSRAGTADKAILNRATGMLHLEGSVHLSDSGSTISTDTLDYNLNTKDVDVHGNPSIMTQPANQAAPPPASAPRGRQTAKPKPKPAPSPKRSP